jgi:prolyl-tRNA editing enzyme YbaK/EbsC (Cys-tRNA(Pro) deacylase)
METFKHIFGLETKLYAVYDESLIRMATIMTHAGTHSTRSASVMLRRCRKI